MPLHASTLVRIAAASDLTLADLASDRIRRIAIAQPGHAPYGLRAKEALQSVSVWEAVQGKLVFGENIAHAAQMAESGAAQVGIIALSLAKFPTLAVNPNYTSINVAQQAHDPQSVLSYYKQMIQLRKEHDVLVYGTYDLILDDHPQVYAYTRTLKEQKVWILCNLSGETAALGDDSVCNAGRLLLGNYPTAGQNAEFRPWEARVLT